MARKIDGLEKFNLAITAEQRGALDAFRDAEAARRGDAGLTVTTLIREAIAEKIARAGKVSS